MTATARVRLFDRTDDLIAAAARRVVNNMPRQKKENDES